MSKKLLNRWIIGGATGLLIVGGSAALATAAFADDSDDVNDNGTQVSQDDDGDDDDNDGDDDGDDGAPATEPKVSLADATATASDEVSKGILTSIELEGNDKSPVWRVDFITSDGTEHEVTVDGTSGKVTDHNKDADEDADDWNEAKAANDQAKTSPEDAAAAALDKVGGNGTVTSVELDDDSNAQWDVDVTTEDGKFKEVSVDATNGKVTDVYTDDDDNDGDDDSDDNDDNDTDDGDDD